MVSVGSGPDRGPRSRSRLLSLIAVLLVPFAIVGLLTWSLSEPEQRIKSVKAAIVNNDKPVKVDGKLAPLGRQLSAKLAGREIRTNYHWEITNEQTAEEGIRDGSYIAVVRIPENFSKAATSYAGDPAKSRQATIDVTSSDRSSPVDRAISQQVTATAADLLGRQLSKTYLENIYLGFNKLHDQLGKVSDGTSSLADGAKRLAGGTGRLSSGAEQLATGNRQLAGGLGRLDDGVGQFSTGISGLSSGLAQLRDKTAAVPPQVSKLAGVANQESTGVQRLADGLGRLSGGLTKLAQNCPPTALQYCDGVEAVAEGAKQLDEGAGKLTLASKGVSGGLDALAGKTPSSRGGLPALAAGVDKLADGAAKLSAGANQLRDGTSRSSDGAARLADGAGSLAGGAGKLGSGAEKLGNGTGKLSSGLDKAVGKLPTYRESGRDRLAGVVSDPVSSSGGTGLERGTDGAARYAVLALWVGALATFLVSRAVPRRVLESTRSTFRLTLRSLRLPSALAVGQSVLVTVVIGLAKDLSLPGWFGCAGLAALIALAFTVLNQALVAALRGVGRLVSILLAVVFLATGLIATAPSLLVRLSEVLPLGPASEGLRDVLGGSGSASAAITALVTWTLIGCAVTYLAIERRRMVRRTALLSGQGAAGSRSRDLRTA